MITPAQDRLVAAAFDVRADEREEVAALLQEWSTAAEQMAAGELVGGEAYQDERLPPRDTGEAWGYPPAGLTVTFGYGRSLFVDADGADRFGLKDRMPAVLADGVPRFANETLREADSDGDLLVQICGNDAQVCMHALRTLTRIAFGRATLRWSQVGFGRTSSTTTGQDTPRNLFGYKDGTANLKAEDGRAELAEHLWVQDGDDSAAPWMVGGTYFVVRKIRMFLEVWDRQSLRDQDAFIGRSKRHGAPLSVVEPTAEDEFAPIDLAARDDEGALRVPVDSHVRVVHPDTNDGVRMLRRGYNYADGNDSLGRLDAGLFFIAFVRDPRTHFYPVLTKMTQQDALTEYLQHHASALFAVPPGIGETGRFPGEALFA
ncbi:Dyp-type peroxidase [Phycicoccus endophyticus]|uniref:Dyp-type peroxidase n=1 Tax=Phycicoccus endophyticus TaxID=1690220 RepID=A0A7G9R687_9MICO|nr:Dyp-type peroxidase [Phycicoccus endophyticus]